MEYLWITVTVLCSSAWESAAITNKGRPFREQGVLRNFRHVPDSPGNVNADWEVGLREAVNQALLRERYHEYDLRDRLLEAPLIGRREVLTTFGDIVVLARGQLYATHGGNFLFVQDQYQNDCHACHNPTPRCTRSHCQVWQPEENEQLVALWTVKRIRHRGPNHDHYYELEYTVSPITPAISQFVTRNGLFDYGIPGHIFVVRNGRPTTDRPRPELVHNKHVPHHHFRPEVLIGVAPDGEKYILHSYPGFYTSFPVHPTYHQNRYSTNDPREIELYKELVQSLASKTSTTQKAETGPHTFSLNTYADTATIPSYDFFPTAQSSKTKPLTESTTSTAASSPVYASSQFATNKNMIPTKPTQLLTTGEKSAKTDTMHPKDHTTEVTRPVTTTIHYFAPVGEEDITTHGATTEMKKITLQAFVTKKPMEQELGNSGIDFLFPEFEKATAPPKTTKEYYTPPSPEGNFLEETDVFPTEATTIYHTSITKAKPESPTSTTSTTTKTVKSTATEPESSPTTTEPSTSATTRTKPTKTTLSTSIMTELESPSTISEPPTSTTTRTTKSTTSKFPTSTTTKAPKSTTTKLSTSTTKISKTTAAMPTPTNLPKPTFPKRPTTKTTARVIEATKPTVVTSKPSTTRRKTSRTTVSTPKTAATQAPKTTDITTTAAKTTTQELPPTVDKTNVTFKTTEIPSTPAIDTTATVQATKIKESNLTGFMSAVSSTTKAKITTYKPKYTKMTVPQLTMITKIMNVMTQRPITTTFTTTQTLSETTRLLSTLPAAASVKTTRQKVMLDLDYTLSEISPTEPMLSTSTPSETNHTEAVGTTKKSEEIVNNLAEGTTGIAFAPSTSTNTLKSTGMYTTPTMELIKTTGVTLQNTTYGSFTTLEETMRSTQSATLSTITENTDTTETLKPTTATSSQEETLTTTNKSESTSQTTSTSTEHTEPLSTKATTTKTTTMSKLTTTNGFLTDNGNDGTPSISQPGNVDFSQDDIFGTVRVEVKPTEAPKMREITDSDIASELFGNRRQPKLLKSYTTALNGRKIIFSNFYKPSTIPSTSATEYVTETEMYETTTNVRPLTSQSYATAISFEVNKKNGSSTEQNPTNTTMPDTTVNDFTMSVDKSSTQSVKATTETSKQDAKKTFDHLALQVINHAKSIDYLNGNKNKTNRAKYKRRKIYVPKNRRLNIKKENL